MKKIIILFSLLFITHIAFGNGLSIKPLKIENPGIPLNIRFLTSGSIIGNKYLRVAILVEEVYPSIFIEEIIKGNVEGEPDIVENYYLISGFDIATKFGYTGGLVELKFNKWNSWNEFEMSDSKIKFVVRYNNKKQFEIVHK